MSHPGEKEVWLREGPPPRERAGSGHGASRWVQQGFARPPGPGGGLPLLPPGSGSSGPTAQRSTEGAARTGSPGASRLTGERECHQTGKLRHGAAVSS